MPICAGLWTANIIFREIERRLYYKINQKKYNIIIYKNLKKRKK